MSVLSSFTSGTTAANALDTLNDALASIATLKASVPPLASFGASTVSQSEGNSGTTTFVFPINLDKQWASDISYEVVVAPIGTNPADASDFVGNAFPRFLVTVPAGTTTINANVLVAGDSNVEPNENFAVRLYRVAASSLGTILNDDSAVAFTAPYNREFVALGDSRMQYSATDTFNGRFYQNASGRGLQHWLPLVTGGALLPAAHAEYGVAGDTPTLILARTGVKSLAALAANRAANAIFLNGSAEAPNSATGVGSNCRRDFATIVANLTTNAGGLTFFNNTPKNLIIMNEWPRGAPNPGKTDSIPTTTAQRQALKQFADWVKLFSYDSGDALANPRVVVIDTFNDPRILDTSTFPDYKNRVGLLEDGVHQTGPMGKVAAQVVADRIGSLFPYNNAIAPLPTSSNLSLFLNSNPLMTGTNGTAATYTYYKGTLVGTLPTGMVLASANNADMTGLTATVTYEGSGDSLAMVVRFTGTVANGWGLTLGQSATSAAATTGINVATDRLILGMEYAQSTASGAQGPATIKLQFTARCSATPASAVTASSECIFGDMVQNGYDTGHDYQRTFAPIIDFNDGNKCTTGVTALENTLEIYGAAGTVDFTVKMRRIGISKLT